MNDVVLSSIRTVVPIIVGSVVAFLAQKGFDIDKDAAILVVSGLCIGVYYLLVRFTEHKWPAVGVLLGSKKQPVYLEPSPPPEA
jgi:hypothetical protein